MQSMLAALDRKRGELDALAVRSDRNEMPRAPTPFILFEGRAALELGSSIALWPWLRNTAPEGAGQPVLTLPGWLATDASTLLLRRYLRALGYHAHRWGQGRNAGPDPALARALAERVAGLADRHGRSVSLVGWSLGGVYARELARRRPELVTRVITLASPLNTRLADEVASSFEVLGPDRLRLRDSRRRPVPLTALFSRSDGIVPWRAARIEEGPYRESIEIVASHTGMGHHPASLRIIADRLAEPARGWRPYRGLSAR
jgi:pimeloyl-ACP methyl ester carboxylesterase